MPWCMAFLGPWRLGEFAPSLKQLANNVLASIGAASASSISASPTLRWGPMGERSEAALVHTPKEIQLQLLLRVNQAVEATMRGLIVVRQG